MKLKKMGNGVGMPKKGNPEHGDGNQWPSGLIIFYDVCLILDSKSWKVSG